MKYSDITESDDGYGAINDLVNKGILPIDSENTFKPEQKISRGEVALLLQRALHLETSENKSDFKDVDTLSPYAEAIIAVTEAGIFQGYGNGKFGVNEKLTNEQLVVIIAKAFQTDISNDELNAKLNLKVSRAEFAVALSSVLNN
nr:S-layer homology domain-containing protein [Chengkuizengella marina]